MNSLPRTSNTNYSLPEAAARRRAGQPPPLLVRLLAALIAASVFVCIAAVRPASAAACEVVVVKSTDLKPYRDALRGFADSCSCDIREMQEDGLQLKSSDIVVAIGTSAFKKVKTLKDQPVAYVMVVSSEFDREPSANISGVSMDVGPDISLATIKEVFPAAKRIGLLYDPRHTRPFVEDAAAAARSAGLELVTAPVRDLAGIMAALEDLRDRMDVLWMLPDPTIAADEAVNYLLRFSIQHSVPLFTFSRKYVEMGAVASLDMDPYDMGAQAGELVNRIAAGAPAVRVYARAARLSINAKTAKKMGLTVRSEALRKGGRP